MSGKLTAPSGNDYLKGKNALVTGSTSGIGLAIAKGLAAAGCNIMLNGIADSNAAKALCEELTSEFSVKVQFNSADMSKPTEIQALMTEFSKQLGPIAVLVNNAGIQHTAPVEDFADDRWESIIAINLSSAFYTTKGALPAMKAAGFGRIINIASVHGLIGSANKSAYVAAKHGIIGLTKVVALENAETPVTCNAICPGWVLTPLVQKQIDDLAAKQAITNEQATAHLLGEKQPSKRFVTCEQIADMVCFLAGPSASGVTGSSMTMDGGWTAC